MNSKIQKMILEALQKELIVLNQQRLIKAYGPSYKIIDNKSLVPPRLNNLSEQKD